MMSSKIKGKGSPTGFKKETKTESLQPVLVSFVNPILC